MNPHIEALNTYLAEHPPCWGISGKPSILEFLQRSYAEFNPIDNDKIRASYQALEQTFSALSFADQELLFRVTDGLCFEYAQEAFMAGLLLGANLMRELTK